MKILPLILLTLFLASCSAGKAEGSAERGKESGVYPDLIMINTRCRVGQSDESPIILSAGKMTLYSSDNYALLEDFSFVSETEDGVMETEGRAASGLIELDGSSITLTGDVTFSRPGDNMTIKAERLVYDRDRDEITTEGKVVVNSDEGTIEGINFRGDLREGVYSFSEITKGDFALE